MDNFIWYFSWIILPLLPSILLFIILPKNKASVGGIFHGMEIKLSGSVAVYFLLIYLTDPIKLNLINKDSFDRNWFLITSFEDENMQPVSSSKLLRVEGIPNWKFEPLDEKRVLVPLQSVEINEDKKITIPYKLRFIFEDFEAKTISSSDYFNQPKFCEVNWQEREISIKNLPKLVLKRKEISDTTIQVEAAVELFSN